MASLLTTVPDNQPSIREPDGWLARRPASIRWLLSLFHHWRGAPATRYWAGTWPHVTPGPSALWRLGPDLGSRFGLLSNAELLALLCEGSPDDRPAHGMALLASLNLDGHDPAALQRALLVADIFRETRERLFRSWGTLRADTCPLAYTRASMARLIAGLGTDLQVAGPAEPAPIPLPAGAALPAVGTTVLRGGISCPVAAPFLPPDDDPMSAQAPLLVVAPAVAAAPAPAAAPVVAPGPGPAAMEPPAIRGWGACYLAQPRFALHVPHTPSAAARMPVSLAAAPAPGPANPPEDGPAETPPSRRRGPGRPRRTAP